MVETFNNNATHQTCLQTYQEMNKSSSYGMNEKVKQTHTEFQDGKIPVRTSLSS